MSALPPSPPSIVQDGHDQYVVSHGKSGAIGVFTSAEPVRLRRGQRVLVQSQRGLEVGAILRPATLLQARLLGATSSGQLLRPTTCDDDIQLATAATLAEAIFEASRAWVARDGLAMEILDVDVCFDAQRAIIQFLGAEHAADSFASALQAHFGCTVLLENLAPPADQDEHEGGCDKPDCGRSAGGGCTTCGTGGGCSSCGSGHVDLREYFGHLRDKMTPNQRISLA